MGAYGIPGPIVYRPEERGACNLNGVDEFLPPALTVGDNSGTG